MSGRDEALRRQAEEDDRIYERYGRPLEATHAGQFIAIARDGRTILSSDDIDVVRRAIAAFGSGNFVFRRIGHPVVGKWRTLGWRYATGGRGRSESAKLIGDGGAK